MTFWKGKFMALVSYKFDRAIEPGNKFGQITAAALRLVIAVCLTTAFIGSPARGIMTAGNDIVELSYKISLDRVPAGESFEAAVLMDLEEEWHVQAVEPTFDYLIPTRLKLDPPDGISVGKVHFPDSKHIEFAGDMIEVYGGRVPLRFLVKVASSVAPGSMVLTGELTYQLCDDQVCIAPETVNIEIPFEVVAADTPVNPTHAEWFDAQPPLPDTAAVAAEPASEIERMFGERGLLPALLAIFLVGLALNLTPCIYPMLSVTVSIFGGRNDGLRCIQIETGDLCQLFRRRLNHMLQLVVAQSK